MYYINEIILGFLIPVPLCITISPPAPHADWCSVSSEHMQTPLHYISFIPRQSDPALYSYSQPSTPVVDCLSSSGYRDIIPRGNYSVYHFYETETETDAS